MGTYDTRGGSPISPDDDSLGDPSRLQEDVMSLLEAAGIADEDIEAIVELVYQAEEKARCSED